MLDAVLQTGLFCEVDGYYDFLCQGKKHEGGPRVTDSIAANGLGEAGRVPVARSLWKRIVPQGLRSVYARATRRAGDLHRSGAENPPMENMLSSVRCVTRGLRHTRPPVSSSVFLRYKNAQKCRLLLNAVRINASDPRPPKKIHVPRLGSLTRVIRKSKSKAGRWMCNIDLQNCYCSISVPRSWRRVFVVEVHGVRYKFTRLPFGWRHSPAICQTLVQALVRSALSKVSKAVGSQVYLDNVLLDPKRRRVLIKGRRAVVRKLRQAGFIIGPKSELAPSKRLVFVGKFLDSVRKSMQN